jgi:hypothetical protein
MRIPGYGRSIKWLTSKVADANKASFLKDLKILYKADRQMEKLPLEIVSFSGKKGFADQCYSILSFLRNVGEPVAWTIYNDGTYDQEEINLFQTLPWVAVVPYVKNIQEAPEIIVRFSEKDIWGKRLVAYMTHRLSITTIFTDSDILFYQEFKKIIPLIRTGNWFMNDTGPNFDSFYCASGLAASSPYLNAGFLIFNSPPKWDILIKYIDDRMKAGNVEHYTEQTAVHKMMVETGQGKTLDENLFILNASDHFTWRVHFAIDKIALRHFVSPVRHKMWQTSWKKVLGI